MVRGFCSGAWLGYGLGFSVGGVWGWLSKSWFAGWGGTSVWSCLQFQPPGKSALVGFEMITLKVFALRSLHVALRCLSIISLLH